MENENQPGLVLKVEIQKNPGVKKASNNSVYLRRGAQSLKVTDQVDLDRLSKNKGIISFEIEKINAPLDIIENSEHIIEFMLEVVPTSEPMVKKAASNNR